MATLAAMVNGLVHSALEEHVRDAVCPQCRHKSSGAWRSEFWGTFHYLTTRCPRCGYELFYKAGASSGIR
ncbi:hypothetical protein JXA12_04525 [Candidatus Woesearchaeota archaeon]|nr:hypothetical protein [Candidatus Woesearchaeota archaeon]